MLGVSMSLRERADRFLSWADSLADGAEPVHQMFRAGGDFPITSVSYRDRPTPGWTSGVTYGASLCGHPHLEFVVVVRSRDPLWTWAVADFVDRHRAEISSINIGDTINWHERIARHSEMDAFVVSGPVSLPPESAVVHLDEKDHVQMLQAVPTYSSELPLIRDIGVGAWAQLVGDQVLDPRRPKLGSDG